MNFFIKAIKKRRSIYSLNKNLPVFPDKIIQLINDSVQYVPDAFDMKSQRVIIIMGDKNTEFWNMVYDTLVAASGGKFSRDKIDSYSAGFGTILYFYDENIVQETQKKYPMYANNFHDWIMQSNGMLQFAIWVGLANLQIGASLQHYNPIIDDKVHEMFNVPKNWQLVAQMPFGGIAEPAREKPYENVSSRVKIEQ